MNAQLSAQIATGASVFPSEHRGNQQHPAPSAPPAGPSQAPPGVPSPAPYGAPPGLSDGYPPAGPPRGPDSAAGHAFPRDGNPLDPAHAANFMSPVGPQYPEHVDWSVAAAVRARAVPPWLLAALFVGALGIALTLTIVIARIIR
jgi:hypothetical protein